MVIILPPGFDQTPGIAERAEQRLVQKLVPKPGVELSAKRTGPACPAGYSRQATPRSLVQAGIAFEVSSVPLSERTASGLPRHPIEFPPHAGTRDRRVGDKPEAVI